MDIDSLLKYVWIAWLALALIFLIIEVSTLEFTFLMLAVGSLGALVAGLLGVPWWGQILVAGILSVLLLFAVRPPLLRQLKRGGDPTLSNIEAVVGLTGVVTNDFSGNATHVKLANGETWTARFSSGHDPVEGERIIVTAIEGATAVVTPAERNES
jgi:membrane protein implicated in regulation of membrane protease activity